MEPLDNPAWHALTSHQARFAEGDGAARRYQHDVAPFAALPDDPDAAAWSVPEMLALVKRTHPGPFFARTHELGAYIGLRDREGLVAMAGVRMRGPGFAEISAVCTDERARRQGLASRLVRAVAAVIEESGDTPILHVVADNASAIRVYDALGFETRAAFDVQVLRAPA